MERVKKFTALCLSVCLLILPASGVEENQPEQAIRNAGTYLMSQVTRPQVGSMGGEWTVLALARSGMTVPEGYFEAYYEAVCAYVTACQGVLHETKYTEYARVVLALTAIGANPRDVGGYDVLSPLEDLSAVSRQGINGICFALLALDSGAYELPREAYVAEILARQLPVGGWSLSGTVADPDVTGIALQALAPYRGDEMVDMAIAQALNWLSEAQTERGGYIGGGEERCESLVQVVVGLCALEIDLFDSRFMKNGITLLDALLSYQRADGSFAGISGGGADLMASEQGLYGLVALQRRLAGKSGLYCMDDVTLCIGGEPAGETGLSGKHPNVAVPGVRYVGLTFSDLEGSDCRNAVEILASRGIINGTDAGVFAPEEHMTRAQFSAVVVRGLGLPLITVDYFSDVESQAWYAPYAGGAWSYGLVQGIGEGRFHPDGEISRQEAAVFLTRAAALCGLDTTRGDDAVQDMLAQFGDYRKTADWARESLAFCYETGILDQSDWNVEAERSVTRGEIAQMVVQLLELSRLI